MNKEPKYSLTQFELFDNVTYQGEQYLIINKNYETGLYSLVNEQTGEEIKVDEEMLRIKKPFVQKREPVRQVRERPTAAPQVPTMVTVEPPREEFTRPPQPKRVTYADLPIREKKSVRQQRKQQKVSSENIADTLLQMIHHSLRLNNESYPPTTERADEIIRNKDIIIKEHIPNINRSQRQQVIKLINDRIEKMYRLTSLSNIRKFSPIEGAIATPGPEFGRVRNVMAYDKGTQRQPQMRQLMDSSSPEVRRSVKNQTNRILSNDQLVERFQKLPDQIKEMVARSVGPNARYDPRSDQMGIDGQVRIPASQRVPDDTSDDRRYERDRARAQSVPLQEMRRIDPERFRIASSDMPRSQRKKAYARLEEDRLERFRERFGLPKNMSKEDLKFQYDLYNSLDDDDLNF